LHSIYSDTLHTPPPSPASEALEEIRGYQIHSRRELDHSHPLDLPRRGGGGGGGGGSGGSGGGSGGGGGGRQRRLAYEIPSRKAVRVVPCERLLAGNLA
jgi:hypothetical protein